MDNAIEKLKAMEAAATPGPWAVREREYDDWGLIRCIDANDEWTHPPVCSTAMSWFIKDGDRGKSEAPAPIDENAKLIAALRNLAPELIALWEAVAIHDEYSCKELPESIFKPFENLKQKAEKIAKDLAEKSIE
jgi:hypothetical protein